MALTGKQARYLRSLAHNLNAVLMVGDKGLTPELFEAAIEQIEHHELIKVKVAGDRDQVKVAAEQLARAVEGDVAQIIGKTIVLYKARKKKPEIRLPSA